MEYGLDKRSNALKIFNTTFIIVWLLVACFPFIWTFWGSFKVRADFFSRADWWYAITAFNTLLETGGKFTTDAYSQAWTEGEFWKASRNTVIVTFFVVTISLFLGTLGAYALSRSTRNYAFWIHVLIFYMKLKELSLVLFGKEILVIIIKILFSSAIMLLIISLLNDNINLIYPAISLVILVMIGLFSYLVCLFFIGFYRKDDIKTFIKDF